MQDYDREKLEQEGWKRQTAIDEPRLSELVEFYKELSFEVILLPFDPEQEPSECTTCFEDADRYRVIYTRKKT